MRDLFLPLGPGSAPGGKLQAAGDPSVTLFEDLDCAQRPTTITESKEFYRVIDRQVAADLKITYIGAANASVGMKTKVFMREFSKFSDCPVSGGKGTVRYGAAWRATVLIDEEDAKGDVTFPMVAASATLRNLSAQVHISTIGFDPVARVGIDEAGHKAMESVKGGLNVTTFSEFAGLMEESIKLAIKADVATPLARIGFQPRQSPELSESVAKAFAIACAAEGRGPDDAIAAFPLKGDSIEQAIRQAFEQLQSQDSNPRVVQLKASALVEGVQIPIKQWYQFWK